MNTDTIADLLTRIRNALRVGHPSVVVPASKTKERVLKVMLDEGYIAGFESQQDDAGKPIFKVQLRYLENGAPVIREMRRVSSPGRRMYVGCEEIPFCRGGLGTVIVSTSQGMMSDREARRLRVGGELVCSMF